MKSIPPDIRKLLEKLMVNSGVLSLEDGTKHVKVRNGITGDWILVAGSPSDHRTMKNFEAALNRLVVHGRGFVYAKTGNIPAMN